MLNWIPNARSSLPIALALVLGCSGAPTAVAPDPAIGTYVLTAVSGHALPAPLPVSGSVTSSIAIAGSIFLGPDGTYSAELQAQDTRGTTTTTSNRGIPSGTWLRSSSTGLTLNPDVSIQLPVTVAYSATSLTFTWLTESYVYRRQ